MEIDKIFGRLKKFKEKKKTQDTKMQSKAKILAKDAKKKLNDKVKKKSEYQQIEKF